MKLRSMLLGAAAVAVSAISSTPAGAGSYSVYVGSTPHYSGGFFGPHLHVRGERPSYRGVRGREHGQPGDVYYGGYWYSDHLFGPQVLVAPPRHHPVTQYYVAREGGTVSHQSGMPAAHYQWCDAKYRSYRGYDNTFQPYHSSRKQCVSPYY